MSAEITSQLLERSLDEIRRLVLSGLGVCPAKVYLFGSRAVGGARENSDIDVAVLPLAPLPYGTLARIRDSLEESTIPWRVDLVDLSTAPPALQARVRAEGIAWTD